MEKTESKNTRGTPVPDVVSGVSAIVEEGAKQYLIKEGDVLVVEQRNDVKVGETIPMANVLWSTLTSKQVDDAKKKDVTVLAEVLEHKQSDKIIVFKKKRRKNYRRKKGHRQNVSVLRIKSISQ
jgi:large subunit ribosomal protein L21